MPDIQHKDTLARANHFLAGHPLRYGDMRPAFHFTAPYGWLNDPNGLIQCNGIYHLFYQHNPYETRWAQLHWGHAISEDLLAWKDMPEALAPSEAYDFDVKGGCFSGSAVMDGNALTLMYTGCVHKGRLQWQTQNIARSTDGIHFIKDVCNPVIAQPPQGGSEHFRDPKVWRQGDCFYAVLCNSMEAKGCVLLYRSEDLQQWEYRGVLHKAQPGQGWMWECPDFFPLENRWMLTVSAIGGTGSRTLWFVGDFDITIERFAPIWQGSLDEGNDFYAAQSFLDEQNRRILIGWADHHSQRKGVPPDAATASSGFCGHLSLPRVVTLAADDTPRFTPIPELIAYRKNPLHGEALCVSAQPILLARLKPAAFEALLVLDLENGTARQIELELRHDERHCTMLTFDRAEGMLRLDCNQTDEIVSGVIACEVGNPGKLTLRLFFDRNSIEIYVQNGEKVISANVFPERDALEMRLSASGGKGPCAAWDLWYIRPCTTAHCSIW